MARNKIFTEKHPISNFKNRVKESDYPYYFESGNVRFFGSKVESVKTTRAGDKFSFKEKLTNSPDGQTKYKFGILDASNRKFKSSDIFDSKQERDLAYNRMNSGLDWE